MSTAQNIETVRNFLAALSSFDTGRLTPLLTEDAMRSEFPNRLKPQGNHQTIAQMLHDAGRAKAVLTAQHYDITQVASFEQGVMVEFRWTGTLAVALGTLKPGDQMTAHCAAAFDFRNGRICGLRNYDCFDPF